MNLSLNKIVFSALLTLVLMDCVNIYASDSLKIITYNIQGMKPGTDPDTRLNHIIGNLVELDPDIIGIQEINETLTDSSTNQAKVIADSLSARFGTGYSYYYSFTHLSWSNTFREFVGIISKYPIEDSGYRQLPPGLFIRKCTWSYIDSPLGMINFFSTHLSHTNIEARKSQVEEIIPFIGETAQNNPGTAAILVGDFNDVPNSESIIMLTGAANGKIFTDTFIKIHPFGNPGYTVDAGNPERRIDYIFLKNNSQLTIEDSYVVMEKPYLGNLYCSDHLGVMTIFTKAPTGLNESGNMTGGFELYQNYPNPFNPVTTIKYSLPDAETSGATSLRVKLYLFDVLGRNVASLVNEEQKSGTYQVNLDASNFPSGIYFYELTAGKFRSTKKLILIK